MRRLLILGLAVAAAAGAVLWLKPGLLDRWRSTPELYRMAQAASIERREEIYTRLEERLPELRGFFLLQRGELDEALRAQPHSLLAQEAHLARARQTRRSGGDASRHYRAALQLLDDPALRLEYALHLEELGRREEAYRVHRELLSVFPEAFADLRRLAPDPIQAAADLVEATYYADALETLEGMAHPRAGRLRGLALLGLGRFDAAEPELRTYLEAEPDDRRALKALGDSLIRQGRREEALNAYQAAATPEADLTRAQLLRASDPEAAIELLLDSPLPLARWTAATWLEEDGRADEAPAHYRHAAQSSEPFADDAAYRLVVLGRRLGDPEVEQAGLSALEARPTTNYLASLVVDHPLEPAEAQSAKPEGMDLEARAEAYRVLGLEARGWEEIRFAAATERRLPVRLWALQQLATEQPVLAQRLAERLLGQMPAAPLELWELAYPRLYWPEVRVQAQANGVDPLLVLAIIREESRFDPSATSVAGARGLMQIMPATGEWIASRLEEDYSLWSLHDPERSIRFGIWYLSTLLDLFKDTEQALAAYNGGPGSVQGWLQDPKVSDPEDFRRWIGFGETREYVSLVMASYRVYQALYG